MNETIRCEPAPELRGVDGWHWVQCTAGPKTDSYAPEVVFWHAAPQGWAEADFTSLVPHYRYLAPVANPAEIEALRAEVEKLRGAAAYQAEAHTLRTAMKMLAETLRSWGWQNGKNEANHMMVSRALGNLHAENARLRERLAKAADALELAGVEPQRARAALAKEADDAK